MAGEVRISVRNLVEFILRSGDIDDRRQGSPENAMQEGSRIHRMIQRRMGAEYQAEVALKYTHPTEDYVIIVEGRADGIIEQNGETTIDEIKGTYRDLSKLKAPLPLHIDEMLRLYVQPAKGAALYPGAADLLQYRDGRYPLFL